MKKITLVTMPLLLSVLFLTACGGKSMSHQSNPGSAQTTAAETMAAPMEEKAEAIDMGNGSAMDTAEGISAESGISRPLPQGRKLIRNVTMRVETDSFEELTSAVQMKIAALGGYIEQSDIAGNSLNHLGEPIPRYASITARIPSNQLDGFITSVEQSGNVINKSESTQDVTLQYSDIESRKKSLLVEQDRIWALLEKAESLDTVITLEQRLSDIRYELESMESQLRLYDNQVDYSTVYLSISEVTKLTPQNPESTGSRIKNGLAKNITVLANAVTSLLIFLITSLPFWLPLAIILFFVVGLVRRRRNTAKKKDALSAGDGPNILDKH